MKIRFAVIGTFWLCEHFVKALLSSDSCVYVAQYSRNYEKGKQFASRFSDNVLIFDDLDALAASNEIDAVYIASPNALHYPQAKKMLAFGKHVLLEKPATLTAAEFADLRAIAKEHDVILTEAMMNAHVPKTGLLANELAQDEIVCVRFDFCQHSSKLDKGEPLSHFSTFSAETGGGALRDLGVYPIALSVRLFGVPERIVARAHGIEGVDVDVSDTVVLQYNRFDAVITVSKLAQSVVRSEIICRNAVYTMQNVSRLDGLCKHTANESIPVGKDYDFEQGFSSEICDFVSYIRNPDERYLTELDRSYETLKIIETILK